MWRGLLNVATALSLVLCIATAALWVRGRGTLDRVWWLRPARTSAGPGYQAWRASFYWGTVEFSYFPSTGMSPGWLGTRASAGDWGLHRERFNIGEPIPEELTPGSPQPGVWRLGIEHEVIAAPPGQDRWQRFAMPLWVPTGVLLVAPIGRVVLSVRKWRRSKRGLCRGRGYDLRASPGRCPECGKGVAA